MAVNYTSGPAYGQTYMILPTDMSTEIGTSIESLSANSPPNSSVRLDVSLK
jgi:hypothetical protein